MINFISSQNNNKLSSDRPEGVTINTIVITYSSTEGDTHKAINTMFDNGTSVHYTIDQNGFQVQHHLESQKTFYAGASHWHGEYGVNNYGIGIMLVNDAKSSFSNEQIEKTIGLIKDIETRHETKMEVVGLGEVNQKHIAPGSFFPWAKLAEAGIGKTVTLPEAIDKTCKISLGDSGEEVLTLQQKLKDLGYETSQTGIYDEVTAKFVTNFSNRYTPEEISNPEINFSDNFTCWTDANEYALNELLGVNNTDNATSEL